MAKLVAVCRSDDYRFERRQLALEVDDNLKMVVQFTDSCVGCDQVSIKQKELERFVTRYLALSKDEIAVGLIVTSKEVFTLLSQLVPCVGCRRSVEQLYRQLMNSGHPAVEPLVVTAKGELSIKHEYLFDAKAVYALFYIHGSNLATVMDGIPKSKKNKRCMLHSLDTHKAKSLGSWMDIWDLLSKECREEAVLIECDNLMDTLENYLRKHRFCSECKAKVLRAYSILVGDLDANTEKGYCPALYEGLSCCHGERHIHVSCGTDFIAHLIGRAEPELTGSRRERHAKTLDIAQEEVLTCLGIHLYERLHRIWQKLRAEEQTWQILFYLGVDALRKNFEVALERKQGISNLELMCQELLEEEQAKEQKREMKRQKRKKKKTKQRQPDDADDVAEIEKENCKCDENTNISSAVCASCDDNHNSNSSVVVNSAPNCRCNKQAEPPNKEVVGGNHSNRSDCGYSSGHEGCDSCSMPSSNDGSDIACSEGICNHDGDSPLCHRPDLPETCCHDCLGAGDVTPTHRHAQARCDKSSSKGLSANGRACNGVDKGRGVLNGHDAPPGGAIRGSCGSGKGKTCCGTDKGRGSIPPGNATEKAQFGLKLTLEDMLEESCSSGEEELFIPEEEIQQFRAKHGTLTSQRLELRETLKQRFANMCHRGCARECCVHRVSEEVSKMSVD